MILIIVLIVVACGLGFSIWKLDKIDEKITLGIDNPYYDNRTTNKMSLNDYEKELENVFDYKSVNNNKFEAVDDFTADDLRFSDEDLEENNDLK